MWRLNIPSKLMLMLQAVSFVAVILIGLLGMITARAALKRASNNQLVSVRNFASQNIRSYFQNIESQVKLLEDDPDVCAALKEFIDSYASTSDRELPADQEKAVRDWYTREVLPQMALPTESEPSLESHLPHRAITRYLQYYYLVTNPHKRRRELNTAADGSPYSATHLKYHPFFRNITDRNGFDGLYMVDASTRNVVYSVNKNPDFATNMKTGPYAQDSLARLLDRVFVEGVEKGSVIVGDYEPYRGAYHKPALFMATPIYSEQRILGILAVRISADEINRILTSGGKWSDVGLGSSGEVYLVGQDRKLRSELREATENPEGFRGSLKATGIPEARLAAIEKFNTTILQIEIRSDAASHALLGATGSTETSDYKGRRVLAAFAPFDLAGVRWGIIASILEAEAYAPIEVLQRQMFLWTVSILVAVALISVPLASSLVRPLKRLASAARQIEAGESNVHVDFPAGDEYHEVGSAFNGMAAALRIQQEEIQRKNAERDELLLNILPGQIASRFKEGEVGIAEYYANVTVLFAELSQFDYATLKLDAMSTAALLTDLFEIFDESAKRFGVETVRTVGSAYLATCGLTHPRIDQVQRMLDFAQDLVQSVLAFEAERNVDLALRVGINSGPVEAGIVGRRRFLYDLWGDTVTVARQIGEGSRDCGILVTDSVRIHAGSAYTFLPVDDRDQAKNGGITLWRLATGNPVSTDEVDVGNE